MSTVALAEQIAEVERELALRRQLYPRWVSAGRMTAGVSRVRIEKMEAVLATLKAIEAAASTELSIDVGV